MSKPRLLDLFCGAGGCSVGYARAWFDVVGVDLHPQPNYPFEFVQGDALEVLRRLQAWGGLPGAIGSHRAEPWYAGFDAIHASPPCQSYIRSGNVAKDGRHPDLLEQTRELLELTGLPWVIENVPGAPMRPDVVLCGSMFGLPIRRHRWFETNWSGPLMTLACDHSQPITGVYGNPHGKNGASSGMLPSDHATWSRGLDIDWMTTSELALAIPPAYTQFIGAALMAHLSTEGRLSPDPENDQEREAACPVTDSPATPSSPSASP